MKPVRLTRHAREQALERGASEAEVTEAVRKGSREPAKRGRELCRYNFAFGQRWQGRMYAIDPCRVTRPYRAATVRERFLLTPRRKGAKRRAGATFLCTAIPLFLQRSENLDVHRDSPALMRKLLSLRRFVASWLGLQDLQDSGMPGLPCQSCSSCPLRVRRAED